MKTLGFIGTGGMGNGMAANLLKGGNQLFVNDLEPERCKLLLDQGAKFAQTPKDIAESCDIVFSMLPNNDAVKEVGCGINGLINARKGANVWIDLSSIDKETIVYTQKIFANSRWTLMDGAAGGVEEVAAAGQLQIWVSGNISSFEKYSNFFTPMAKSVMYVGELGNAKLVKNAMAMLAAVNHMAILEIFSWLKQGGLTASTFESIMGDSMWNSAASRNIMRKVTTGKYKPRKSWMPKDVGFGLEIARDMEVPMPFVSLASQMFSIAQATENDEWEATGIAANVYDLINKKTK